MKFIREKILAFLLFGCSTGCVTAAEDGRLFVDRERGEVAIYSTADARSTFEEEENTKEILNLEKSLKEYLRKNRRDLESILSLAKVQVILGKYELAEKNCRLALRLDLKNKEARKILAQVAIRRGNYDMASIFLASIGGANTKDSAVLNMLAMIELQRGNNSSAMAYFRESIRLNSDDIAARLNLGVLLLKFRMLNQAAIEFERVLKISPANSDAKIHLAVIMLARGEKSEAEAMLRGVLAESKNNPLALYNLAVVQKANDELDQALNTLKEYVKTAKGRASDEEQLFALIDDIRKSQVEQGRPVSDEDFQQLSFAVRDRVANSEKSAATHRSRARAGEKAASSNQKLGDIGNHEGAGTSARGLSK